MIPFLDLKAQFEEVGEEITRRVSEVLASGNYVLGPYVEMFEREFAKFSGVEHCVAVNSGTSALQLALMAYDVGPGDEVVTVSQTFIATVASIEYCGATPVLVDVDASRQTMCVEKLKAAITPKTKVIMPVHLFGQPADMSAINQIAKSHNIPVVADAAQAHGATYRNLPISAHSDTAAFSFYPGKNLGACGEGGAIVTNDPDVAGRIRVMRDWGQVEKNKHSCLGFNYRMDAVQGAALSVKLEKLAAWTEARRAKATLYREEFGALDMPSSFELPEQYADSESSYHLYVVRTPKRDLIREKLAEQEIQTGVHYPYPVHLTEAFGKLGLGRGSLPISEENADSVLSLPIYPELSDDNVRRIARAVKSVLEKY